METILRNSKTTLHFRNAILILIALLFSHISLHSQLSGTRTIGTGGDYSTFTDAVNALNTQGVNGPVIFNVISGTYTEQFTINNIAGSSATNNVIFQSQSGDSTAVVLQWTSTATADNYVVTIHGGKYITFRKMTFKALGTNFGTLAEIKSFAGNITFNNNLFLGLDANDGTYNKTIISGDDKNLTNIIVRNNRFANGSQTIFFQGYNDKFITGCEITDNIIINCGFAGVRTNWVFGAVVTGNEIESKKNGIYVRSERGDGNYSYNRIKAAYSGIDIQHNEASAQKTRIYNNFISVSNTNAAFGITIPNTVTTEIFNNSVYIKSKYPLSAAFKAEGGSATAGVDIRNNNFVCANKGYTLYIITPAAISEMSNNNLYTEGNFIAKWGAEEIADLHDLQSVSGMNENSLAVYPHYVSFTDLHTIAPWLDGKGAVIPYISDDIDRDPRDPANPDIGADEFTSDPEYQAKLSGAYTIGSNGYYRDCTSALNDALLRGISGPVIFNIQNGSYNEQINIRNIPGSSSLNTVTFRSESGNYEDVKISYAATAETPNYVISFLSADFIHLKNVSVYATGELYSRVINLSQGCDSIVLENNHMEGRVVVDGTDKAHLINSDSSYFRSRILRGNILRNGSYGIYMRRELNDDLHLKGAVIEDNNITGTGYWGIYVQFHESPVIKRNTISAKSGGIRLISCTGPSVISGNQISSVAQEGIYIATCVAATNNRGLITNNFIQGGGTGDIAGIFLNGAEHFSVLYNSINVTSNYPSAKAFYIGSGTDTRVIVKNNIFSNKGGAFAYYVLAPATVVESDYNDLFTTGGPLAYWGTSNYTDLTSLSTASGMDMHSVSVNPLFVSDTDLHTTAAQLDGKAVPLPEVTTDINGRRRDIIVPDIGAVEFGPIANYAPVALNDTTAIETGIKLRIDVLANDSDPDGDQIKITGARSPKHGNVAVDPSGLELSYTSTPGYVGPDSCIYIISDDYGLKDSAWVLVDVEPLPLFSLTDIDIIDLSHSSVAWGDYDDDGDPDILITGWLGTNNNYASRIYRNDKGIFTDSGIDLRGVCSGTSHSAEWMDLDNDNDLDVIITGSKNNSTDAKTLIYRNNGGKFAEWDQSPVTQSDNGSVDWSDFNHDGSYDLLIAGNIGTTTISFSRIYKNTGPDVNGDCMLEPYADLDGIWSGESMWVDFDKDGDPDIFSCGFGADPSKLYQNNDGVFTAVQTNLPSVGNAACDWGDYDNDGDMDLALIGREGTTYLTKILRNDGFAGKAYTFTDIGASLVQVSSGDIAWGDYDNDGDLDLVYTGNTGTFTSITKLYENIQGVFTEKSTPFRDVGRSTLAWGDYDGDSDLDLIIAGFSPSLNRPFTGVYRNNHNLQGKMPLTPVNLTSSSQGEEGVLLSWDPADAGPGKINGPITYNLRIGTEQGGSDILSPIANVTTGLRKNARNGNTGLSESFLISGLRGGKKYFWSIQSVDAAFRGSAFAEEKSFYVQYDNSLSGQVWDRAGTGPINKSTVVLFPESNINDTIQLKLNGTNSYLFSDLPSGRYTILAIPDPVEYDEFIPTYLGNTQLLRNAIWVQVTGQVTAPAIRLINAPPSNTGSYLVSGSLIIDYSGAKGISVGEKSGETKGSPVPGTSVFLTNASDGSLKAWDLTGTDGKFEFSSLPAGSYIFIADFQGKPMADPNPVLTLSEERKNIEIMANVGIDKIKVVDISTGTEKINLKGFRVYPVPATDNLVIDIPEGIFSGNQLRLRIFNLSGGCVSDEAIYDLSDHQITIDISKLPRGIYLLQLTDNRISHKVKIIKAY